MATNVQIMCINKTDRSSRHERISHVGGVNADGTRWKITEDAAIAGIRNGTWSFWTAGGGESTWVIIVKHPIWPAAGSVDTRLN
jgi:hypothetical protein